MLESHKLFDLHGRIAIVTGGTGVLGGAMARGLALAGATVWILGRNEDKAEQVVREISEAGGKVFVLIADVLDKEALVRARDRIIQEHRRIDILINAAGGNTQGAIIGGEVTFFNMAREAYENVLALNLTGTVLCCQIFGEVMAQQGSGSIINISSMTAERPLTRVLGYGNAKAGVDNLTRWLAVDMAQKHGLGLRVNAIAPGFFIGDQNRSVLVNEDGALTERGKLIIAHTPMGRFGEPEDLIGTMLWLASDASKFVTGTIIPVDGGFSAYHGI